MSVLNSEAFYDLDLIELNKGEILSVVGQASPLSGLRPDLPAPFCHTVAKLIEKRPQDRFAKWHDVRGAVSRAFGPAPVAAAAAPSINTLMATVGQLHDHLSKRVLAADAREAEEAQWQQLNEFQAKKLIEELRAAVDAFNQSSHLAQIQFNQRGPQQFELLLPFGAGPLLVKFFAVKPELPLKRGKVRFAALVSDLDRSGMNFLLFRDDDQDLYGRWVPLKGRISALVDPRKCPPRPEPFGFEQGEMKDVALCDRAMHIFNIDYLEVAAGEAFLQTVQTTLQRRKK